MSKEKDIKKLTSNLFAEIFKMGIREGRSVSPETEKDAEEVIGYLNRQYLTQKGRKFFRELKKIGILPIKSKAA